MLVALVVAALVPASAHAAGAKITGAYFERAPQVGKPVFLRVGARDRTRPVSGAVIYTAPDVDHVVGGSACRLPGFPVTKRKVVFRLPYIFRAAGPQTVRVAVLSGRCGQKARVSTKEISVNVAAGAAVSSAHAAATCPNASLVPTDSATSRLVGQSVLCLVNAERRKFGRKPLRSSARLTTAAAAHSNDMVRRAFFAHDSPGGPSLGARIKRVKYRGRLKGENIGFGFRFNAALIVQGWMNSPPHRANILDPKFRFGGTGIVAAIPLRPAAVPGSTSTMVFGSSRR